MAYKSLFKKIRGSKYAKPEVVADSSILADAEVLTLSLRDPNAFGEIVNRYERLFVRKAREIVHNEDDAYDVVQETFVRIYSAAKRFKSKDNASFRSWAYTILVRQCYSFYKKQKRAEAFSVPLDPELLEIIPDQAGVDERERVLSMGSALALISRLPAKLKRIVELHFLEGTSQKEIAEMEHISPVAVRVRIHRAKRELHKMHLESGLQLY
ncbi:MAG: RNA polymerase sigma factor [Candidatus Paceibacterota bacterium]